MHVPLWLHDVDLLDIRSCRGVEASLVKNVVVTIGPSLVPRLETPF